MAVARVGGYRNSASVSDPNNATLVANLPQAATAGNLLVLSVYAYQQSGTAPQWTPPSGWTATIPRTPTSDASYSDEYAVYTKVAAGGETTATFTGITTNPGTLVVTAVELSGSLGIDAANTARNNATGNTSISAQLSTSGTHNDYVLAFFAMNVNAGNGGSVAQGTWSGGVASDQPNTEVPPSNQASGSGESVYVAGAVGALTAGTAGAPTYSYSPPGTLTGSAARLGLLAIKSTIAGSGGGARVPKQYPGTAVDSGNVRKLTSTAVTAASNTKLTTPALGNVSMRFVPEATSGTSNSNVPASQTITDGGWQLNPLIALGDAGTLKSGTLTCVVNVTAAAALGAASVTAILHVNGAEVTRATSPAATLAANTATSYTAAIAVPQTALPANSAVGVSLWLTVPLNTNLGTTAVTMNYGGSGTSVTGLDYSVQAVRALAAASVTIATLLRATKLFRVLAASATAAPVLARQVSYRRAVAATAAGVASAIKQVGRTLATASTGTARANNSYQLTYRFSATGTASILRSIRLTLRTQASASPTLRYAITVARTFTVKSTAAARTLLQFSDTVLARLGGGATVVVKKIIAVFDD